MQEDKVIHYGTIGVSGVEHLSILLENRKNIKIRNCRIGRVAMKGDGDFRERRFSKKTRKPREKSTLFENLVLRGKHEIISK